MSTSFSDYVDVGGITTGAFTEIDLRRNIDGVLDAAGQVRLYDLAKNILVENKGSSDLIVKWSAPQEEPDLSDPEWRGIKIGAGKAANLIYEINNKELRIPSKLYLRSTAGTGSALVNLALFYSIFE